MSLRLRMVLVLAAALFVGAASLNPALALSRGEIRNVQEQLVLLGYSTGPIDGVYGRVTRSAIVRFQKDASIRVDGVVGPETRAALDDFTSRQGSRYRPRAANIQLDAYEDVLTDRLVAEGKVTLESRYANVEIRRAGEGRYAVAINGQVVATSPIGTGVPRISHPFELPGEDVYLVSSMSGNRACRLEHATFVVRANGSFMQPTPVGNCDDLLNARVEDDALVMSFPPKKVPSWRLEESWIYRYGKVTMK